MGFSENLENNLKNLESVEERDPQAIARNLARREADRQARIKAAPFTKELREGPFTQSLLGHATRIGFSKRVKVYITWIESNLRLEARNLRLELRPTAAGIEGHFLTDGHETASEVIDLSGDPEVLAERWLSGMQ